MRVNNASNMQFLKLCLAFSFVIIVDTEAARVLAFYPCPSISHQIGFRPITMELLNRGHHVTEVTPDPIFKKGETPANLTEIDVHDVSYKIIKEKFVSVITGKKTDLINQVQAIVSLNSILVEEHFKFQGVQDLLKYEGNKFDLLLLEAYYTAILGLTQKFRAPAILRNIARLRQLMLDQPQTPLERTMWWIEYVLQHGGAKHLRAPAANMSWSEYLDLELVVFILFGVLASMAMVFVVIRFIVLILFAKHKLPNALNHKLPKKIN